MKNGYAICLNKWALDKSIKSELGLLLIISSLTAKEGYCFASNEYLGEQLDVDPTTISKKIAKLDKAGLIKIKYERRGAEITKREIRLAEMPTDDWRLYQPTLGEKPKDNSTSSNKKTKTKKKGFPKETIEEVVNTYNAATLGVIPWGRVIRALQPLVGLYEPEVMLMGWRRYVAETEPRFLSVEAFVRRAGLYIKSIRKAPKRSTSEEDFEKMRTTPEGRMIMESKKELNKGERK